MIFCIFLLACAAEFRDQLERSLSLRQPPPGSAFARDTARSRSLGRPGGASGLASVLGIQDHLVEVLGNSVEVFGFRWRSQLSSSGLYVFLFLNIFLGRNHGSRATNTFASLSFYSAPLPILTNLLYLKSKNTKVRGSTFASCFQIIQKRCRAPDLIALRAHL